MVPNGRSVREWVVFQQAHKGSQKAGVNLGVFACFGGSGRRKVVFELSLGLGEKFVSGKLAELLKLSQPQVPRVSLLT